MAYFTFSQGFRPGGFNRAVSNVAKDASGKPQFTRPNGYAPDSLNNYEIGTKSEFFNHRLQLNLSAYYMEWKNVQFGFYNPTELGNTTFGTNGPDYHIKGLETQFVGKVTDDITLQGSGSYNDSTQATSPCLVGNIQGSPTNGQCITSVRPNGSAVAVPFVNPFGSIGSNPAFSPKFTGDIRARYDWKMDDYKFFATVGGNYVTSMYNQPATYPSGNGVVVPNTTQLRYLQPGYGTLNANINLLKDNWGVSLYGSNLLNSHASVFTSSAQFIKSEVPIRPAVVGVKLNASF
jgi:outer membrane receptor protein involved in Fe transport